MTPLQKAIATGITATAGGGLMYQNYRSMSDEAKKEIDPIETTLDGLEKYVLDPVGTLTPGQAITGLAALTAAGIGGKKLLDMQNQENKQKAN
tara:strand:- start:142 stop:420 length:279 start_codon:yes stop_codon:yes gene_type:complete